MIQVINRALDILEYLSIEPNDPKSLSVIANNFKLNPGTCANIIKTLMERKYVEKIDKRGYCLGSKAYALTGNTGYQKDLVKAATKEMEFLTAKYNENSLIASLINNTRSAVVRVSGTQDIQVITSKEKSVYDTATGRLLLAMLPEAELHKFVVKYGLPKGEEWTAVKTEKSLLAQLESIRNNGYAKKVTTGKIIGFAVPVYITDKIINSLCLYMPEYRFKQTDEKLIVADLLTTAKAIEAALQK